MDLNDQFIRRLYSVTTKCLDYDTAKKLLKATLEAVEGKSSIGDLIEIRFRYAYRDIYFRIPLSQLPEAWANLLHVYCYHDYDKLPRYTPKPGMSILDAGAYLGFYTIYAALMLRYRGLIIAVEPNPYARRYLYENLELNQVENLVQVDPRAISSKNSVRTLYVSPYWALSSLYPEYLALLGYENSEIEVVKIVTVTLRELLQDHDVEAVNMAKIDVEGAEQEVLPECIYSPCFQKSVVEVHQNMVGMSKIVASYASSGYEVEIVDVNLPIQLFIYISRTV